MPKWWNRQTRHLEGVVPNGCAGSNPAFGIFFFITESPMCLIVIPARYASTRFPGKPLVKINGKPMVIHVYQRALKSKLAKKVIIATDDRRIFQCAEQFNAEVEITDSGLKSGTDRVFQVAKNYDFNIIVNVQGDEPFIEPNVIDEAITALQDSTAHITTPVKKITDRDEISNPNVVKVVFDKNKFALYFSRSPVPYCRDGQDEYVFYKHIGLYCYTKNSLEKFVNLQQSHLEKAENLEQLRALENGMKIKIFVTDYESMGIDTPSDLEKIKTLTSF